MIEMIKNITGFQVISSVWGLKFLCFLLSLVLTHTSILFLFVVYNSLCQDAEISKFDLKVHRFFLDDSSLGLCLFVNFLIQDA